MTLLRNFSRRWTISLLIIVKSYRILFFRGSVIIGVGNHISHFLFGVCMTVCKRYSIPNEDIINIVYLIEVKLDIGDGDIALNDIIEHPINSEEDLAKIPELEEKAKKREEELEEKAKKLMRMASKLEDMGYVVVKPVLDEATGEWVYKFDDF